MLPPSDRVRLDKWLWAARFYKSRALAAEAIDGGKVHANGTRAKRARMVGVGDRLEVRQGPYEYVVEVRGLSERRGPAKQASLLYQETPESIAGRERVAQQLKTAHVLFVTDSRERPTKRDRRRLEEFRKRSGWE
jgi:ribosome-associated heat shock protein Hsp15